MPTAATALAPTALRRQSARAARLMRALSNRHRLMILCVLSEGERSVGELNARLPLSQSALSQHLAVLRGEGLVETRREAQTIYYRAPEGPAMEIVRLLHDRLCGIAPLEEPKPRARQSRSRKGAIP
jgi:DNA-binding transcriptional ArsR family regulator